MAALAIAVPSHAALDLSRASVERLPNGLTLIMLEDHSFPLVSTQMLYKSGSRDETAGKTGLAHFLEHLAFRASANFPDAGATEAIYDAGGEWHGYTWLDQTTYYSTMPKDGLDLLLRIEADRMANVTIDPAAIAAEKGAVITELHGYENDADSVVLDTLTATAITAHPYRNNTIGFESDVAGLTLDDSRAFYERHYGPGNAVLAIAGEIDPAAARALVMRHFGGLKPRPLPDRTKAVEPLQRGERRATLHGPVERPRFAIAFPAPAASSDDFAAFLVLQQLLSGGSGVNFRQNDWGSAAEDGSILAGAADGVASWFIPTADPYVFVIKGEARDTAAMSGIEAEIARRLGTVASVSAARLASAKAAVRRHLVEDVESTEDAAHQLAYFEGIGALEALTGLEARVDAVAPADISRLAEAYLTPQQKSIVWMVPGTVSARERPGIGSPRPAAARAGQAAATRAMPPPVLGKLEGGLPYLFQRSSLSPSVTVRLVTSAPLDGEELPRDLAGLGAVVRSGPAADLPRLIDAVRTASHGPAPSPPPPPPPSRDPETRMEQLIVQAMGIAPGVPRPIAFIVSGDLTQAEFERATARAGFGQYEPRAEQRRADASNAPPVIRERIDLPLSQGSLGYVVHLPVQPARAALAARMLLYILTHDYSGRLGRSAIGEKGLAYHIYSALRSDGANGWATIWTGVDPTSADALEAELRAQIEGLVRNPPTAAEIAAARRHLVGRSLSAAQSNEELTAKLARDFLDNGTVQTTAELQRDVDAIGPADLAGVAAAFTRGTIIRIDVAKPPTTDSRLRKDLSCSESLSACSSPSP